MDLEFSNITYKVNGGWREKEGRTLLHGISGSFRSGQLSAIMGPSGAGKSTLLNMLSGYRGAEMRVQGVMKINGRPMDHRLFHKLSRFIAQEDLLQPLLTTYEAMMFAANLKLPSTTSKEEKEVEVRHILKLLGLGECGDTRVETLSGGQRKRLSLALEMINNPSIFFLDEPTSGLDNVSTRQCLQLLRKLAKEQRTIVCTIHQPSASLFEMFDHIYILGRGKCVYQGPADQLLPFLSLAGFHCPTYHNPSDFVMEVIDSSHSNVAVLSKAIENGKLCHSGPGPSYEQLQGIDGANYREMEAIPHVWPLYSGNKMEKDGGSSCQRYTSVSYPTGGYEQFFTLLKRMLRQHLRNKTALKISFLHHLACGLLFGCVFYKSANDAHQMFNHMKYCVSYVLFYTYTNIMMPVLTYPSQVKLLKKEHFNRWYSLSPYYGALILTKLPTQFLFGLMFSSLVYFMAGLPAQPFRFLLFFLIGLMVTFVADSLGMAIGSIFNVTNGSAVGPAVVAPLLGLAVYGFDFARQVSWFTYAVMKLSFIRCAVVATAITLFGFGRGTMECNERCEKRLKERMAKMTIMITQPLRFTATTRNSERL